VIWRVERTPSQDFGLCIVEASKICPTTSYKWVQSGAMLLLPNQLHNHMADVQVMCLHFSFQKHLCGLGIK